jgi:hypothetical protein
MISPPAKPDRASTIYGTLWTDDELRSAIRAYQRLLDADARGASLSKQEVAEALMQVTGRTRASVERRFQNISAILVERGLPRVSGYPPQAHYPQRLVELMEDVGLI